MLLMQLKGVNNEQILCTVQYTMLFSKYIVLETLACLITFIYTGCVETISVSLVQRCHYLARKIATQYQYQNQLQIYSQHNTNSNNRI